MKNPVVKTTRTSQGLVRAGAMSPPQRFMVGIEPDFPFQSAVIDFLFEVVDPLAFRIEHCDLVLELDQRQPAHSVVSELGEDTGKLFCIWFELHCPVPKFL